MVINFVAYVDSVRLSLDLKHVNNELEGFYNVKRLLDKLKVTFLQEA